MDDTNVISVTLWVIYTGSSYNSRILGEMKSHELQNLEFQGPPYLGLDVP